MNFSHNRVGLLAGILAACVFVVALISFVILFRYSEEQQRQWLWRVVQTQAATIQEMYRSNRGLLGDEKQQALRETLSQVAFAQAKLGDLSVRYSIAALHGDDVRFMVMNGRLVVEGEGDSLRISSDDQLGKPILRALMGEQGVVQSEDHRGNSVIAAFRPLMVVEGIQLAIVAKTPLVDYQATVLKPGGIAILSGLVVGFVGLYFFFRLGGPLFDDVRRGEEEYRHLVEGSGSVILRLSPDGMIQFMNHFAASFFSVDPNASSQGVGKSVFGSIFTDTEKNRTEFSGLVSRLAAAGANVIAMEIPYPMASGGEGWLAWTFSSLPDSSGRMVQILAVGNDITARKRAEEARRESEERFRTIASASPVGILIMDMHGNPTYANEQLLSMAGCTFIDIVGGGWTRIVHPDDRGRVRSRLIGGATQKRDTRVEFRIGKERKSNRWVLGQAVAMRNLKGESAGIVVTLTDITSAKRAEARYRRLITALDQAAEVVIITDPEGIIQYVNPAFVSTTGYSREEAIGNTTAILKSGEHEQEFFAEFWETITKGEVWKGTFRNKRKDGVVYDLESTVGPVKDDSGQIVNFVDVARDISERVELETQLRHAQKLESIGQLAAGIAHEINTPIQYVGDNLRYLGESFEEVRKVIDAAVQALEGLAGEEAEKALQDVKELMEKVDMEFLMEEIPSAISQSSEGAGHVAEIVRSMKEFSHPGGDEMQAVHLNENIRNTINVARNEWRYVANLEMDLSDDLPTVIGMAGELNQVVLNMIINAAHAIEDRGEETGKGTITIRTYRREGYAVMEIEDNGMGMPPDVLQRVFDPFYTTKDVGRGTGQGLAIAHNVVVVRHGGRIDVKSTLGKGTTFVVSLPIARQEDI